MSITPTATNHKKQEKDICLFLKNVCFLKYRGNFEFIISEIHFTQRIE